MPHPRTPIALLFAVSLALTALAQEPVEAIRSVVAALNKSRIDSDPQAFSRLFTQDGSIRIGSKVLASGQTEIADLLEDPLIWSEVTAPHIENESVRFVFPGIALVDAMQVRYGSLLLKQSTPITLLMELDGQEWRIISMWLHPATGYLPL